MSQYNTKHSILFSIILASMAMIAALAGCTDDLLRQQDIPDVDVEINADVIFKPFLATEVKTRTRAMAPEGAEFTGIKSLYVLFFTSDGEYKSEYSGYVDFTPHPSDGATHEHVTFKKTVHAGRYYIYAVANISEEDRVRLEGIRTIEALKEMKVTWSDDISKDIEMFGVFRNDGVGTAPDNEGFEADELVTVTPVTNDIHSWVRRAESKVTVDFDGTGLKDGVTVYIKEARLKDVADGALLCAAPSRIGANDIGKFENPKYSITYGEGQNHTGWPSVTRTHTFSPKDIWGDQSAGSFHSDNARALPCYENMQGEPEGKSKLQDSDGDGIIDSEFPKDGVDNGTYLEVEGYYVANRPEYKSQGKIKYRFMLGKDAVKNFDLVRNHHYKITMRLKDYGNDVDWHIEYEEQYLDATFPDDVNYQGKFLQTDYDYNNMPNHGHTFSDQNTITLTSFKTDGTNKDWIEPEITYTYYSHNDRTGGWDTDNTTAGWLTTTPGDEIKDGQRQYTFVASMANPTSKKIKDSFPSKGPGVSPYNLSGIDGGSTVYNTANCYMVGAPGEYCFPLVYGNAITDGKTNGEAYASEHIVNHLNNNIKKPYIKDNAGINLDPSNVEVRLIWQDAENLISTTDLVYDPNMFDKKGGIKFKIGTISEGNAVIALIDKSAKEDDFVKIDRGSVYGTGGSTRAIWSWHIWVTRFGFDFGADTRITNHEGLQYDVLPVNLGWCAGDTPIKYYPRRKCEIKFKIGDHELVRTIEQYPHIVLPRGDHPYYQWGRKDPFVGTNVAGGNKVRWIHDGTRYEIWGDTYNPPRLYEDPPIFKNNTTRKHTKDCLDALVKNPDKWHNAPREHNDPKDPKSDFHSINQSYDDLWSNGGAKTVYDPCPPGYQVTSYRPFSGFTTTGRDEVVGIHWNDVLERDMLPKDYYTGSINSQVLAFYTDARKIQSITFPVSGYRDFDQRAGVVSYPSGSYYGEGFVWFNEAKDGTNSYHLKFRRNDLTGGWEWRGAIVAFFEKFYNTDGFGIRPVRCRTK